MVYLVLDDTITSTRYRLPPSSAKIASLTSLGAPTDDGRDDDDIEQPCNL